MSTVRVLQSRALPPRRPAHRDRRIVELVGLDGATSLAKLLDALHRTGRRLPVHVAVYVTHELARALRHVHDRVDSQGRPLQRVHGAVNANNVLLLRSGRVKLIARGVAGARGDRHADLFMLGLAAWEMLVGWPAPEAEVSSEYPTGVPPSALRPGLPKVVDDMVMRALDRRPTRRYPSAGTLAGETARFLATRPDPRRGLRVLLNEILDGAQHVADESSATRLTRVPWRDATESLPALPPLPPSGPAAPVSSTTTAPGAAFSPPARGRMRRWLARLGIFLFQAAVAAILAWAALLALNVSRHVDPPAPVPPPSHGTVIVPITPAAPPARQTIMRERRNPKRR